MSYRFLLLSLGVTLIFVQLIKIDSSFLIQYNTFSYGNFTKNVVTKKPSTYFKKFFTQTDYTAFEEKKVDSIVFTGDVMLARNVEVLMEREGGQYPFKGLNFTSLFPNAAIVGNFEASMAKQHTVTPTNQLKFSVNPLFLGGLKTAGFTHFSLANNHSYDYGEDGFANTRAQFNSIGLKQFGSENKVTEDSVSFIHTKQGEVALIGINASDGKQSKSDILKIMKYAEKKSDIQIAYIHWGIEYDKTHHSSQKNMAQYLVENGADVIIGHHPHVVQDIDVIDGVPVFYSLGNYIFDQYFSPNVQEGLVLVLEFTPEARITLLPVSSIKTLSQPTLMEPNEHLNFLKNLAKKSNPLLSEDIQNGFVSLYSTVATSTKIAMIHQ